MYLRFICFLSFFNTVSTHTYKTFVVSLLQPKKPAAKPAPAPAPVPAAKSETAGGFNVGLLNKVKATKSADSSDEDEWTD